MLIPAIKKIFGLQVGHSILAAGIVLALMIFPTISNVAADSISSVPVSYTHLGTIILKMEITAGSF